MPVSSLTTFMNVPYAPLGTPVDADVAILGIPYDLGTTQRPGTRFGPEAIRLASKALQWEPKRWPWDFVLADRLRVVDAGDVEFPAGQTELMASAAIAATTALLKSGKRVLSFGGDHYVTLPLLRALHSVHGPVALLHFDAHTDTDVSAHDHHGVMFHHAVNERLLHPTASIQIGIRTFYERDSHPFAVVDADWANGHGAEAVVERIRATVGNRPVYLTFDIDCLDPAFAPGTGTPVAGGLSSEFVLRILRGLVGLTLVGADVVEVSPPYDSASITALAGATIALDTLHLMARPG
jgi:agmatinase